MKKFSKLLFFTIILFGCDKEATINLDEDIYEFADSFKKLPNLKNKDYLISVKKDSIDKIQVYRLSIRLNLLEKDEIPNKIEIYNDSKIVFFTKEMKGNNINTLIKDLESKGFYNVKPKYYFSHYPELIILTDGKNKLKVNDMSYFDLDSILKKYNKELSKWD